LKAQSWVFGSLTEKETTLKPLCERVEALFQPSATNRLCRYFADWDDPQLMHIIGPRFRGFHVAYSARAEMPQYLSACFFYLPDVSIDVRFEDMIAFDNLIYIRDSTCSDTTGLVTTYARELQHVVQHVDTPRLLAANHVLFRKLKTVEPTAIVTDCPHEREANIVSKRVAESILGTEAVRVFAEEQVSLMHEAGEDQQEARWTFFRDVPSSTQYDLLEATLSLVKQYKNVIDFEMDMDDPRWWVGPSKQSGKPKPPHSPRW
jgi:hypothetical protein